MNQKNQTTSFYLRLLAFSFVSVLTTISLISLIAQASGVSTTIGTNISTNGTLTVNGASILNTLSPIGGTIKASSSIQITGTTTLYSLLGVGTSSPSQKLGVQGNAFFSGDISNVGNINATGSLALSNTIGTTTIPFGQGLTLGNYQFALQQNSGRLGIGTSSPSQAFTLNGGSFLQTGSTTSRGDTTTTSIGGPVLISGVRFAASVSVGAIAIQGKYAYLALSANPPNFAVVDISNPASTTVATSSQLVSTIMNSLVVSGRYAYEGDAGNRIRIIDISNPNNPVIRAQGPALDRGNFLFLQGHYLYSANVTTSNGGSTFQINDIMPNQQFQIKKLGSIDYGTNGQSIFVQGKYAYLVMSASATSSEFQIIDVSDPNNPVQIGSGIEFGVNVNKVYVSGKYAYVVTSANTSGNEFQIIDISNPSSPVVVGGYENSNNDMNGLFVSGKYAYIGDSTNRQLKVLNISNPTAPFLVGATGNLGGNISQINVVGKYAYVGQSSGVTSPFPAANPNGYHFMVFDISGIDSPSATIGSVSANTLDVSENATVRNNLYIDSGLDVGFQGISTDGPLTVSASTTKSDFLFGLVIGTSTPATTSPNYNSFDSSTLLVEATSSKSIPLTIRGSGVQLRNFFQVQDYLNNNLLVFTASSSLGISTTSPSQLLSVQGNAFFSGNLTNVANITATGTLTLSGTSGTSTIASGQGFTIGSSQFVVQQGSGFVGIGTTTPAWNLQLAGTRPLFTIRDNNAAVNFKHWTLSSQGGNFYVATSTDALATSTVPAFMISNTGNVGIGTTSPSSSLSIQGTCIDNGPGCADYAELYPSSEPVESGDILAFDSDHPGQVKKAISSNNSLLIGAVSSNPAVIIEGSALQLMTGSKYQSNPDKPAIALSGRIPVKINLEGGDIKVGDPITVSSQPGIGTKVHSLSSGQSVKIIGYALENLNQQIMQERSQNNKVPTLILFVNNAYYQEPISESGNNSLASQVLGQVIDKVKQWLESMQVYVADGVVKWTGLAADLVTADQLQFKDQTSGQIYCLFIENGILKKTFGSCDSSSVGNNQTSVIDASAVDGMPVDK